MKVKFLNLCRILLPIFFLLVFLGCGTDTDRQKALDMMTARTLGLAYIEEDKLPEAESTFKELITIAPKEALGYANLGLVYIRMGDYKNAEKQLQKALEIEPHDPEIQLNLAEVYFLTNQSEKAVNLLEETLRYHPDHIRTLYKLGQTYARSDIQDLIDRAEELLTHVVEFIPANITARLDLIDLLLRRKKGEAAGSYLGNIKSQMPEFPNKANEFYNTCLSSINRSDFSNALTQFNIFRNILKPTPLYRMGSDQLKGIGGPLIGTPVISFRRDMVEVSTTREVILDAIRFTDASDAAGLTKIPLLRADSSRTNDAAYILTHADFDGNGTEDLYVSGFSPEENKNYHFLLQNKFGRFEDMSASAGIVHQGRDISASFCDFNNDGYMDLYVVNDVSNLLYYHFEAGKFRDIANSAGVSGSGSGVSACFADFDHDGDLDLYKSNEIQNEFFRNNLDGTFTEVAEKMNVSGVKTPSGQTVFGDFDDDGDLDFFVTNRNTQNNLYSNLRQGQFADIAAQWGLTYSGGTNSVAAGDYNNDGLLDLFIAGNAGFAGLFTNQNAERFVKNEFSGEIEIRLQNYNSTDAEFFDFDNDGFLDLVVSGQGTGASWNHNGLMLFHNEGKGNFRDVSSLLPLNVPPVQQIELADYNEDGDLDIFVCANDGKVYLYRNDGGNANRYLTVQLVGLRTGSGKNNYFGIGAKLEVKAGDLYQSQVVTQAVSHFGLGQREKADVVRVLWTNGVPQNIFEPGSDQALLEKQILKGSCPFLYAWNGQNYEFVTDVLWRSALGMPLGIMAGETAYAFSDPSQDYFKIPGNMLRQKDGYYSLQLTSELWETAYFDQVKLITVDHPDTVEIYVNEKFTPPPYPPFHIYKVTNKKFPKSVVDDKGNDLLQKIMFKDFDYISNLQPDRYQGITKPHDLIIDLGRLPKQDSLILFLNGWVFPTDASINQAVSQSASIKTKPPSLEILDDNGEWQTVYENIGFPMGKNKYVIVDLKGKLLQENHLIRISTTMQIYWDYIFFTHGKQNVPIRIKTSYPEKANIHYRGFSRMYRKGGPYGPFWFDYMDVNPDPLWRDLEGFCTRYGDVVDLLRDADSKYVITNAGDEISIGFATLSFPEIPAGWIRDFIILTDGWLKDGDLNTATGQTVQPLPFREMSCYPYGTEEAYPTDGEYGEFLKNYVTRKVTTDKFRKKLSKNESF